MEVEWLILADAAQIAGNKLYLMGGGWDRLTIHRPLPVQQQMAVAVAFRVDWNETNMKHQFEIEVADADGVTLGKVSGSMEVGRPPGITPGQEQRTQIAVGLGVPIKQLGTYVIIARVNGEEGRRFPFSVVDGTGTGAPPGT
ncbi:MAG: hypothetical protein V3S98_00275 [Dehalococcoidia bacterium]|nr:hypothetical protein [Chloroflexota bacterium]MCH8974314.1 hypothetical protein [Chloroflexota bacterium]